MYTYIEETLWSYWIFVNFPTLSLLFYLIVFLQQYYTFVIVLYCLCRRSAAKKNIVKIKSKKNSRYSIKIFWVFCASIMMAWIYGIFCSEVRQFISLQMFCRWSLRTPTHSPPAFDGHNTGWSFSRETLSYYFKNGCNFRKYRFRLIGDQ